MRLREFLGVVFVLLFGLGVQAQSSAPADPQLLHRPPAKAANSVVPHGQISLDVTVSDAQGKPVAGLQPWDLQLADNGNPAKILSFRGFDGVGAKPSPPVRVILVIDEINLPFEQVAFVRSELTRFLRRDGGRLAQPTMLIRFTDHGLRVEKIATQDGNALVKVVGQIQGQVSLFNPAMGGDGALERFQVSERAMASIAENEASKPGRKLLVWIGPGWPMMESTRFESPDLVNKRRYFDAIVELTNKLREARITVNSVSGAAADPGSALSYQRFVKPVPSPREASSGNLALKVLAAQTGGRILGPGNDLAEQINACIADANSFYSISFNPPAGVHAEEFHELKVAIDKPGLTARTNAGYYGVPGEDQPAPR